MSREKLDLNETIGEVLAIVGDEAKRKRVTVRTQFAMSFPLSLEIGFNYSRWF